MLGLGIDEGRRLEVGSWVLGSAGWEGRMGGEDGGRGKRHGALSRVMLIL